jgi:plasmid maintenance system killer protein
LEVRFANLELQRLYTDNLGAEKYPEELVKLFRRRIRHIEASKDLQDLRSAGGVRFDRLPSDNGDKCSLGLDESHRLIISEQDGVGTKPILVHAIARRRVGTL